MAASFARLKSGDWGVRVSGQSVQAGDTITVTKKDGSSDTVVVDKVLWTGDGLLLCSIRPTSGGGRGRGRAVCAECGRGGPLVEDLEDGLYKHYRCCDIPS
jgi:hypothetical protein